MTLIALIWQWFRRRRRRRKGAPTIGYNVWMDEPVILNPDWICRIDLPTKGATL